MKKSNKKLVAVIVLFFLCVTSFSASVAIGLTELFKAVDVGDPFRMITSKTYEQSNELQADFVNQLNMLHWGIVSPENEDSGDDGLAASMWEKGFRFYVTNGSEALTNLTEGGKVVRGPAEALPEYLRGAEGGILTAGELEVLGKSEGAYRIFSGSRLTGVPQVNQGTVYEDRRLVNQIMSYGSENLLGSGTDGELTVYLAFTQDYVSNAKIAYESVRAEVKIGAIISLICALVSLIFFIALCVLCGKQKEDGTPVLTGIDRWFSELLIGGVIFSIVMSCLVCVGASEAYYSYQYDVYGYYDSYDLYYGSSAADSVETVIMAAGLWVTSAVGLLFMMALVKKSKAGRFIKDFLIVRFFTWLWTGLRDIYYGSSVMKKVVIMVALISLGSATVVFFPVVLVISLVFAARWVKQYEAIKTGVREVKNGNPAYKIPIEGEPDGELQQLAGDINAISEGFDLAVKQELKNQRMKTELISNVSHDIKTPLTSIITYVDLLKKEGLDCEDAPKYLDVLDQKSIRLKKLTEDLFEAAKVSSGDIPVNLERVELLSLLSQTLGEMDDRLTDRGLEVIVKAEQERYYVEADGQLMWRVLENLFGNVIKYALDHSRVYIDIREEAISENSSVAVLEMKNVSRNPLNIPADELMERFKRGDEARSTEGSGLGLSIARDLMNIQRGRFDIIIDGDLFKAKIALNTCQ